MMHDPEQVPETLGAPTGRWEVRQIQEVAEVNPRIDKKAIPDDIEVSFVPMPAVKAESGTIDVSQTKLAQEVKKGFTVFLEGDVLFAKITPCMENGKMAIAPALVNDYGFGSTEFHVLRPSEDLDAKYLYYYVSSKSFRGEAERFMTGAVGQKRVSTTYIKEATIPVAPLDDQRRIVAEIEKQFSRLDEAVASLKRVKANLKRYKAAVLKAAVEGKLTEEWRKQNPNVEPASKLLERILAERRTKWEEAELAKMKAKGKEPKDDRWKNNYQAPTIAEGQVHLPEGWVWSSVEQISEVQLGKMLDRKKHTKGTKKSYLRNINIRWGSIDTEDCLEMYFQGHELARYGLEAGDVLVCEGGEPGRAAIWDGRFPDMKYQKALHRVRLSKGINAGLLVIYLEYLGKSGRLERWFTGTTIKHFTRESISSLPFPVPPEDEQALVLAVVEQSLSLVKNLEHDVECSLRRAMNLRQSFLSEMFSGKCSAAANLHHIDESLR